MAAVLYRQGEMSSWFYYLHSGRVKISLLRPDGLEKTLAIHEPPTLVGECAAFDQRPYFATCTALEDSVGRLVSVNDVLAEMKKDPEIALELGRALAHKMRLLAYHVADLSFLDAMSRVGHLLLKMAEDFGILGSGGKRLSVDLTHQDIADLTGVSRVTVTNILNSFQRRGFIRKKRKEITVADEIRLRHYLRL